MERKVIEIQGKLYQIVRTISEAQVNGNIDALKAWVDMLHADRSFRHQGKYYIVNDIIDINIENE